MTNKYTSFGIRANDTFGALNRLGFLKYYQDSYLLRLYYPRATITPDLFEWQINNPDQTQIQNFLDDISMRHFYMRVPKGNWQLDFNVPEDLCDIQVSSKIIGYSPFGCFYTEPDRKEKKQN